MIRELEMQEIEKVYREEMSVDFPPEELKSPELIRRLKEEGRYLARILDQTGGNISEACEVTGLSRSRLYALLKRYGLTR